MSLSAQAEAQRHAKVRVSQQYIFITGDQGVGGNAFPLVALDSGGNGRAEEKKPAIEEADRPYNNTVLIVSKQASRQEEWRVLVTSHRLVSMIHSLLSNFR